jgi:Na+-driven multidrug efflux pump
MFQALGNTLPPLMSSLLRLALTLGPALWLAQAAGFRMLWIWYLSVATGLVQMGINLLLLRRELRVRLTPSAG